jgi:hypothetical protein
MRAPFLAVLAILWLVGPFGVETLVGLQRADAATCGRADYPDAGSFREDAVVNATLWRSFRTAGGFSGGVEGQGSVEVRVTDAGRVHVVSLEEVLVVQYTGGAFAEATALALRVREETGGGQMVAAHNLTLQSVADRAGGNLTLVARLGAGALDIFWRWAYLPCTEDFVNAYYVFHGRVGGLSTTTPWCTSRPRVRVGPRRSTSSS